eukprot:2221234-Prymnesium_polylepis.1
MAPNGSKWLQIAPEWPSRQPLAPSRMAVEAGPLDRFHLQLEEVPAVLDDRLGRRLVVVDQVFAQPAVARVARLGPLVLEQARVHGVVALGQLVEPLARSLLLLEGLEARADALQRQQASAAAQSVAGRTCGSERGKTL